MSTKIFNTRLQLKYDSWKNWYDNNPTLLAGEIAIVNVPAQTNESTGEVTQKPAILFKVGDGTTDFRTLDWASGLAADVYGWAKKEHAEASDITVKDTEGNFTTVESKDVESILAFLKKEIDAMGGDNGSISEQIADGIAALGTASAAEGNYVSGVKVENGKLVLEETALPDYSNTYAAKNLEQTVAEHIEAVKDYDSRITAAQSQADKGVADAAAAKSAADSAQATANKAYVLPEGGIEADLSDAVKASLAKANSALQTHQDISHLATNERVDGVEERVEAIEEVVDTHATKAELEAEAATARAAEKTNADAIAVLNGNDATEGSVDKKIKDAFNKFATDVTDDNVVNSYKELIDYAAEHGSEFTELVGEVDANTKAIATLNGDSSTSGSIDKKIADAIAGENLAQYETKADASSKLTEAKGYTDTEIGEEITARNAAIEAAEGRAAADATTKANTAETNAKAYTDEEIGKLHTVAKSGKIEDLKQEAEYVIFNCGSSSTLVSEPITE